MFNDYHNNGTIKTTMDNVEMSNIWISQNFLSVHSLSKQVKQRHYDRDLQIWNNTISLLSRGKDINYIKKD